MTDNKSRGSRSASKNYGPEFGVRYESLRAQGMTQKDIAKELGCSTGTLLRLFGGAKKRGRPAHQRDERIAGEVREMAGMGLSLHDIARVLSISDGVIKKLYQEDMKIGIAVANRTVANSLFRAATADRPNVTACIFWLKSRAGWRDTPDDEKEEDAPVRAAALIETMDKIYAAAMDEAKRRRDEVRKDRASLYEPESA